jgi:hypothetical protein
MHLYSFSHFDRTPWSLLALVLSSLSFYESLLEALRLFVNKMDRLATSLMAYVKGRKGDGLESVHVVIEDSGLEEGFVFNAIDCDLLGSVFNMKGVQWHAIARYSLVKIPVNFGLEVSKTSLL